MDLLLPLPLPVPREEEEEDGSGLCFFREEGEGGDDSRRSRFRADDEVAVDVVVVDVEAAVPFFPPLIFFAALLGPAPPFPAAAALAAFLFSYIIRM